MLSQLTELNASGLSRRKVDGLVLVSLLDILSSFVFFFIFSRGHHCSASYGLRAVDPHHVVRYLVLLLVDNSYTNSSNKLTRKLRSKKRAKRDGEVVIYRLRCDVTKTATGSCHYDNVIIKDKFLKTAYLD